MKKRNTIHFKRWKGSVKGSIVIRIKENRDEGELHMAVSLGVLPTIRGEEAKRLLSKLKETTLEKETLKKYAEEVENFFDIKE